MSLPMTPPHAQAKDNLKLALAVREASRALTALYLELDESIVNDVKNKVESAFTEYTAALDARERETWEKAANFAIGQVKALRNNHDNIIHNNACHIIANWCRRQGGGG